MDNYMYENALMNRGYAQPVSWTPYKAIVGNALGLSQPIPNGMTPQAYSNERRIMSDYYKSNIVAGTGAAIGGTALTAGAYYVVNAGAQAVLSSSLVSSSISATGGLLGTAAGSMASALPGAGLITRGAASILNLGADAAAAIAPAETNILVSTLGSAASTIEGGAVGSTLGTGLAGLGMAAIPYLAGMYASYKAAGFAYSAYKGHALGNRLSLDMYAKGDRILPGIYGGFSGYERNRFVSAIENKAMADSGYRGLASTSFYKVGDYNKKLDRASSIINVATDMGIFDNSSSYEAFEKKALNIVAKVEKLAKILEKTDSAILGTMRSFNNSGMTDVSAISNSILTNSAIAKIGGLNPNSINNYSLGMMQVGNVNGFSPEVSDQMAKDSLRLMMGARRNGFSDRDLAAGGGMSASATRAVQSKMAYINNITFKRGIVPYLDEQGNLNPDYNTRDVNTAPIGNMNNIQNQLKFSRFLRNPNNADFINNIEMKHLIEKARQEGGDIDANIEKYLITANMRNGMSIKDADLAAQATIKGYKMLPEIKSEELIYSTRTSLKREGRSGSFKTAKEIYGLAGGATFVPAGTLTPSMKAANKYLARIHASAAKGAHANYIKSANDIRNDFKYANNPFDILDTSKMNSEELRVFEKAKNGERLTKEEYIVFAGLEGAMKKGAHDAGISVDQVDSGIKKIGVSVGYGDLFGDTERDIQLKAEGAPGFFARLGSWMGNEYDYYFGNQNIENEYSYSYSNIGGKNVNLNADMAVLMRITGIEGQKLIKRLTSYNLPRKKRMAILRRLSALASASGNKIAIKAVNTMYEVNKQAGESFLGRYAQAGAFSTISHAADRAIANARRSVGKILYQERSKAELAGDTNKVNLIDDLVDGSLSGTGYLKQIDTIAEKTALLQKLGVDTTGLNSGKINELFKEKSGDPKAEAAANKIITQEKFQKIIDDSMASDPDNSALDSKKSSSGSISGGKSSKILAEAAKTMKLVTSTQTKNLGIMQELFEQLRKLKGGTS